MPFSSYKQFKVEPGQIRVLDIQPARWLEDVYCELAVLTLADEPEYEALSYVWGDTRDTVPISVNGEQFNATRNLFCALRRLRHSNKPRRVWVDAVCINQNDLDERESTVQMMAEIYSLAKEVQVYIGESRVLEHVSLDEQATWDDPKRMVWHNSHSYQIRAADQPVTVVDRKGGVEDKYLWIQFHERQQCRPEKEFGDLPLIEQLRQADVGAITIISLLGHVRCLTHCLQGSSKNPIWVSALESLEHIAQKPWWSRVWVLQEVILAKDASVIYGDMVIPLSLIEDGGSTIPRHNEKDGCCLELWNQLPSRQQQQLRLFAKHTSAIESLRERHTYIRDGAERDLRLYLEQSRSRQATDARDKIYGLLGLVKDYRDDAAIYIRPSYRTSTEEVYTEFAIKMVRQQGSLRFLLSNEQKLLNTNLPSWVQNWTAPSSCDDFNDFLKLDRRFNYFCAGKDPNYSPQVLSGRALCIEGIEIDTLASTYGPFYRETDAPLLIFQLLCNVVGRKLSPNVSELDTDPMYASFASTFFGGLLASSSSGQLFNHVTYRRTRRSDAYYVQFAAHIWSGDAGFEPESNSAEMQSISRDLLTTMRNTNPRLLPEANIRTTMHWLTESFWLANHNRSFFRTAENRFGSGPPEMVAGDRIFAVRGCSMLLVLRPAETPDIEGIPRHPVYGYCYHLVGWAFLDGFMDGEALEEQSEAKGGLIPQLVRSCFARPRGRGVHRLYLV